MRNSIRKRTNISDLGEFGLIERIRKLSSPKYRPAVVGIGDDTAVLKVSASRSLLATTDILVEGVHFDLSFTDFYSLGWKSAAVNISDIAAMGGAPRYCLTALGIPRGISADQILDFYRGFNDLLVRCKTSLVGGDTSASGKGLFISVTALGEAAPGRIVTRSGALPGDKVFVTGTLGDSAAGLEILKNRRKGGAGGKGKNAEYLLERHLRPVPRIDEGAKLALARCSNAMIDVSDGLSSDLFHICRESRVGAVIRVAAIPLSSELKIMARHLKQQILQYALNGGEDYELLFTVPPAKLSKLRTLNVPVTEIGTITRGRSVRITDDAGKSRPLQRAGYNHFRKGGI